MVQVKSLHGKALAAVFHDDLNAKPCAWFNSVHRLGVTWFDGFLGKAKNVIPGQDQH